MSWDDMAITFRGENELKIKRLCGSANGSRRRLIGGGQ